MALGYALYNRPITATYTHRQIHRQTHMWAVRPIKSTDCPRMIDRQTDQRAVVALMTSKVPWPKLGSLYALQAGCSL